MRSPETIVSDWYSGEVGGAAMFALLASRATPSAAIKWRALEGVESYIGQRLAVMLRARGSVLPDTSHVGVRAHERCEPLRDQTWRQQMQWLQRIADSALQKMRIEAATLPAQLAAAGELIVAHEVMLVEFAELELAAADAAHSDTHGKAPDSLRLVQEFLAHDALDQQGRQ